MKTMMQQGGNIKRRPFMLLATGLLAGALLLEPAHAASSNLRPKPDDLSKITAQLIWCRTAVIERAQAVIYPPATGQCMSIADLQSGTEGLIPQFVDHTQRGGNFSGMTNIPMWTATNLFRTLPGHSQSSTSWRRKTVATGNGWAPEGPMQVGDVIGDWLSEDLSNALAKLCWIARGGTWSANGENNCRWGSAVGSPETNLSAVCAAAESAWATNPPISVDFTPCAISDIGNGDGNGNEKFARIQRAYAYAKCTSFPPRAGPVDIYFATAWWCNQDLPFSIFSDHGDNITRSEALFLQRSGDVYTNNVYNGSGTFLSEKIGRIDSMPAWCDYPEPENHNYLGYTADSYPTLVLKLFAAGNGDKPKGGKKNTGQGPLPGQQSSQPSSPVMDVPVKPPLPTDLETFRLLFETISAPAVFNNSTNANWR